MPKLVIEDVEPDLVSRLQDRAAARHQTVDQLLHEILQRAAPSRQVAAEALRRIRGMTPANPQSDSTVVIRRLRDG